MATALAAMIYGGNKLIDRQSGLSAAEATASWRGHRPPRPSSPIITVPYEVGPETADQMVSEIASDMHRVAPNQDQTEANTVIRTYLPPKDRKNYRVFGGEQFFFTVDTDSGKILTKPKPSAKKG